MGKLALPERVRQGAGLQGKVQGDVAVVVAVVVRVVVKVVVVRPELRGEQLTWFSRTTQQRSLINIVGDIMTVIISLMTVIKNN